MSAKIIPFAKAEEDDRGVVFFRVPVDDATVARLMTVADEAHSDPATIIASILHDVLKDDEDAHMLTAPDRPGSLN